MGDGSVEGALLSYHGAEGSFAAPFVSDREVDDSGSSLLRLALFPPRRDGANTHSRDSRRHRAHGGEEGAEMSPCACQLHRKWPLSVPGCILPSLRGNGGCWSQWFGIHGQRVGEGGSSRWPAALDGDSPCAITASSLLLVLLVVVVAGRSARGRFHVHGESAALQRARVNVDRG